MGRTLPSITQEFLMEQEAFMRFRRALRRSDQIALDDLFVSAQKHLAATAYAAHALPLETFMLSMLLEEHKEVQRLRRQMDEITGQLPAGEERMLLDEEIESPMAEPVEAMHVVEARSDFKPAAPRQARGTDNPVAERDIPEAEPVEAPEYELAPVPRGDLSRAGIETPEVIDVDPS